MKKNIKLNDNILATTNDIVDVLVSMRIAANLTKKEISDLMGVPLAIVEHFESKVGVPTLALLSSYAKAIGANMNLSIESTKKLLVR